MWFHISNATYKRVNPETIGLDRVLYDQSQLSLELARAHFYEAYPDSDMPRDTLIEAEIA
jgi:hypothetical protein